MGMGKTEAALYAAYQMLVQEKATGIYFALPTQLTSNKIYDRFNSFLHQIVSTETPQHALLLHSGAWLMDTEMGEEGSPGGAWFNHRKRGLLAPFAVGTIDQALMAVMNVKHGFVRAYGLAGKVVILDEVHTYDLYTGTILNALVEFLRQIDCTVIILSATLSQTRRDALLQQSTTSEAYPLITARHQRNGSAVWSRLAFPSPRIPPSSSILVVKMSPRGKRRCGAQSSGSRFYGLRTPLPKLNKRIWTWPAGRSRRDVKQDSYIPVLRPSTATGMSNAGSRFTAGRVGPNVNSADAF